MFAAIATRPMRFSRVVSMDKPRVLIGCEFSGVVRRAFTAGGFDAYSCDIIPSEDNSPRHIQCDLFDIIMDDWDLAILHPPCTYLASSGARWWKDRAKEQAAAINFVEALWAAPIPLIAIENPIGKLSNVLGKPSQIIQPWQFGHGETKATCLWLKGLPLLEPTDIVPGRENRIHKMGETKNRWKERSRTFEGVAAAMADQWGKVVLNG